MLYTAIDQAIGSTPLVELQRMTRERSAAARVFAKVEYFNPTGSAKDRAARYIIDAAERSGELKPGGVVVEATSGNTGIGLASIAAARGYKAIIIMPDTMSKERITLMQAYGAEVVLSDGSKGMAGSLETLSQVKAQYPGCFEAGQFENPANAQAHYETTGPEIWADLQGQVDVLVAGVGTGGTITGCGRYLKEQNPQLHVVAVEPKDSPLLSEGHTGAHGLQGIGPNFVPGVLDTQVYDEIMQVTTDDAYAMARMLGKTEGMMCGISSGAALWAAFEVAQRAEFAQKNIVVVLPDSGDRYLSIPLFGNAE